MRVPDSDRNQIGYWKIPKRRGKFNTSNDFFSFLPRMLGLLQRDIIKAMRLIIMNKLCISV